MTLLRSSTLNILYIVSNKRVNLNQSGFMYHNRVPHTFSSTKTNIVTIVINFFMTKTYRKPNQNFETVELFFFK